MKFQPGQSGNPNGRPKIPPEVKELFRSHTKEAVETLVEAMRNADTWPARISASQTLLDRAWGKAPQSMTGEDGEGPAELVIRWAKPGD